MIKHGKNTITFCFDDISLPNVLFGVISPVFLIVEFHLIKSALDNSELIVLLKVDIYLLDSISIGRCSRVEGKSSVLLSCLRANAINKESILV